MREIVEKRMSGFINALANKEYDQLSQFVTVDAVWLREGESPEEHLQDMVTWIEESYALWEEDEGRSFFMDPYNPEEFRDFRWSGDRGDAIYWPTCRGEALVFVFEIDITLDDQGQPLVFVQINV